MDQICCFQPDHRRSCQCFLLSSIHKNSFVIKLYYLVCSNLHLPTSTPLSVKVSRFVLYREFQFTVNNVFRQQHVWREREMIYYRHKIQKTDCYGPGIVMKNILHSVGELRSIKLTNVQPHHINIIPK